MAQIVQVRPVPKTSRRRRRIGPRRLPPWTPLLGLVAVAGAVNLVVDPAGPIALPFGSAPVVTAWRSAMPVQVAGAFRLCGAGRWTDCVVDGDTIRYRGKIIRLADIDTPETKEPRCASEAARGRAATRRLLALVNSGPFEIRRVSGRDTDIYGRSLRILARNGRSLGDSLVGEGLARPYGHGRRSWCG